MDDSASSSLLNLAQKRFEQLEPPEKRLLTEVAQRVPINLKGESIRAECLAWLCSNRARPHLTHQGIQLQNVKVVGALDLSHVRLDAPLLLTEAELEAVDLTYGELSLLNISKSTLKSFTATGLTVARSLKLIDAEVDETVQLKLASVGGNLDCGGCKIWNKFRDRSPSQNAFDADSIRVTGSVYLDGESRFVRFMSNGRVCLSSAHIGGELSCKYGKFDNPEGEAFAADYIHVGTQLCFTRAELVGTTSLVGANIGGDLAFRGSELTAKRLEDAALRLDAAAIGHDLFLDGDGQSLKVYGTLSLINTRVEDSLKIRDVERPEQMVLDLRFAKARMFLDDDRSWPESGNLLLTGFEYQTLFRGYSASKSSNKKRRILRHEVNAHLDWLRRRSLQAFDSYDVLAAALTRNGKEKVAKEIRIWKERDQRRQQDNWLYRFIKWALLDATIRHGHYPLRLLRYWIFFLVLGSVMFELAYQIELMVRADYGSMTVVDGSLIEGSLEFSVDMDYCRGSYPPFQSIVYSLDTLVPVIDLQQDRYWYISDRPEKLSLRQAICFDKVNTRFLRFDNERFESLIRGYLRVHILAGWVMTTLLIQVVVTRFMQQQDAD
ncbi:MAG: hypothetical protein ACFB4J_11240 [Elainellaceae cyanobacterium]